MGKRAFDGEPEEEREVKRPKAKIMSQQPDEEKQEDDVEMKTNDEIIVEETKEEEEEEKEMFEPYHRSYSYHTSSIICNGGCMVRIRTMVWFKHFFFFFFFFFGFFYYYLVICFHFNNLM